MAAKSAQSVEIEDASEYATTKMHGDMNKKLSSFSAFIEADNNS